MTKDQIVETAGKVSTKMVDAISSPVLLFLIVLVGIMNGGMLWVWHTHSQQTLGMLTATINACTSIQR